MKVVIFNSMGLVEGKDGKLGEGILGSSPGSSQTQSLVSHIWISKELMEPGWVGKQAENQQFFLALNSKT